MPALLDTHAAIWYVFDRKKLSSSALAYIRRSVERGSPVYVSAISLVETIYLMEAWPCFTGRESTPMGSSQGSAAWVIGNSSG
jgi:predicted nucleic-acid-binding protein